MTRKKYRLIAVMLQLIAQVVGGVLLFLFAPQNIFTDIGSDPLAHLCLRLAVYSNAAMALFTIFVIANTSETRWLRALAGAGAVYNFMAGADSIRTALGYAGVNVAEPVFGPAVMHGVLFILLLIAALLPEKK
ncbi:MAG: hypothetical protein JEZ00_08390 [Anaerolineaceae bacterium]|nr:hypothetical protein [Anaerolineaceae bacterium]